jgi:hypothetical protein
MTDACASTKVRILTHEELRSAACCAQVRDELTCFFWYKRTNTDTWEAAQRCLASVALSLLALLVQTYQQ